MPPLLDRLPSNTVGRDFVVGDIHGHFQRLEKLLDAVDFNTRTDRLFALGDLIDRGPDSAAAADWIERPYFYGIRGNHEQMLLDATDPMNPLNALPANTTWQANGGAWFHRLDGATQTRIRTTIATLPIALEVALPDGDTAALVHANVWRHDWGLTRDRLIADPIDNVLLEQLCWSRQLAIHVRHRAIANLNHTPEQIAGIDVIWFGHTPMPSPIKDGNTRWLDTGVFLEEGGLSIAELAVDGRVWHLRNADEKIVQSWLSADR